MTSNVVTFTEADNKEWLKDQHATLWGDWQITDDGGLTSASRWMMRQMQSLAAWMIERENNHE